MHKESGLITESRIDTELFSKNEEYYYKKARLKKSLFYFLKEFWHVVEPGAELKTNWTMEAVCLHLEAVTNGDIRNLIINIPPRTSKSLMVNVFWPAWQWASKPSEQFIFSAYSDSLALRDSVKCRTLIESTAYRKYFSDGTQLRKDQNTKHEFVNMSGGHRIITTVGGSSTGKGGGVLICDDPNDAKHARSKTRLEETQYWWDSVMSTRLNDAKTGSRVVIQQRIAEGDLTGHVLRKQKDLSDEDITKYVHLFIPMEYEEGRSCSTKIGWEDPRTEEGELAWEERFGKEEIISYKRDLGSQGYAGQMQQRPTPASGAIFKRNWFKFYKALPELDYKAISVDCTFKNTDGSDYVAMGVWGVKDVNKYLLWLVRKRLDFPETLAELAALNRRFPDVRYNLVEDKANGSAVLSVFKNKIKGMLAFNPGTNSKEARAASIAPQVEAGNLWLPSSYYAPNRELAWIDMVDDYIEELVTFPKGPHDDMCFIKGTKILTTKGDKPIECITHNDILVTPLGFAKCSGSKSNGFKDVINNCGLTGTGDHKIFNNKDTLFKNLDETNESDVSTFTWKQLIHWTHLKMSCLEELDSLSWDREGIIFLKKRTEVTPRAFMLLFGSIITKKQSQRVLLFIIKTLTILIMQLIIWGYWRTRNIAHYTLRRIKERACTEKSKREVFNLSSEHGVYYANSVLVSNCDMTSQILIKIGDKVGWLNELSKLDNNKETTKNFTDNVADLMGWDLGNDIDPLDEYLEDNYE